VYNSGSMGYHRNHAISVYNMDVKANHRSQFLEILLDVSEHECFKGLVHPKMKIKSLIAHPHAVPTP